MVYLLRQFDDGIVDVQFSAGVEVPPTPLQNNQTDSEAHPASYQKGTNSCFTGNEVIWA